MVDQKKLPEEKPDPTKCSGCKKDISKKVSDYSIQNFGKPLCMECQDIVRKEPGKQTIQDNQETKDEERQGIPFKDLLSIAHKAGLQKIETELIRLEEGLAVFKAKVTMKQKGLEQIFEAHGDATKENIQNSWIKPHWIRMAETRSVARALRFATDTGTVAEEET